MEEKYRKLERVAVSSEFMEEIFHKGVHCLTVNGLPDDAKYRSVYYDHARDVFFFIFESEEFKVVPEGAVIPLANVVLLNKNKEFEKFLVAESL